MNDPEPSLWQNLVFDVDGATVVPVVTAALTRLGLYVVRSFDWHSAWAPQAECQCPQHGPAQCTCQFIVLLVYGEAPPPVTLTLHGRDRRTQLQIVNDATVCPDPHLAEQVMLALLEMGVALPVG